MKATAHKILAFAITLCLCLTLCCVSVPAAYGFTDVPQDHWAYAEICRAADGGIAKGYPDGSFQPQEKVTGQQFAVMIVRAFYAQELAACGKEGEWYYPSLSLASELGLLEGTQLENGAASAWTDESCVRPISRYDMAQLIFNVLRIGGKSADETKRLAARGQISDWKNVPVGYAEAVESCYALGILSGYPDGSFSGSSAMNRAEGCIVIGRALSCLGSEPEIPAANTLANGKAITEENVKEILAQLKAEYPDGTPFGEPGTKDNHSYTDAPGSILSRRGFAPGVSLQFGCGGFSALASDRIFGADAYPIRCQNDYSKIRVGDIIVYKNAQTGTTEHLAIVIHVERSQTKVAERSFTVTKFQTADGNVNKNTKTGRDGYVVWGGESGGGNKYAIEPARGLIVEVWTRYPESMDNDIASNLEAEREYAAALKVAQDLHNTEIRCANCGYLMRAENDPDNFDSNGSVFMVCGVCHKWYLCGECVSEEMLAAHESSCTGSIFD